MNSFNKMDVLHCTFVLRLCFVSQVGDKLELEMFQLSKPVSICTYRQQCAVDIMLFELSCSFSVWTAGDANDTLNVVVFHPGWTSHFVYQGNWQQMIQSFIE
jgi:hypothetical protein